MEGKELMLLIELRDTMLMDSTQLDVLYGDDFFQV